MNINTESSFAKEEVKNFLKSTVPNSQIESKSRELVKAQFADINKALLQKDLNFLDKVRKFLDKTLFEF